MRIIKLIAVSTVLILPLIPAVAPLAFAEEELAGEAKREHDRAVKKLVYEMKQERSNEVLTARIARLGKEGSRVARDALMMYVIGNKNQAMVNEAFRALAVIKDKQSIEFLCGKHALKSRNFLVQETAVNALGASEDRRAVGPLVEIMRGRRTKEAVIEACGYALTKCGPRTEEGLRALLDFSSHSKSSIRIACLAGLGQTGCDAAYERLVEALRKDTNTGARGAAAAGLGGLGRKEALPHLKAALKREGATTVKAKIRSAIGAIGE